MIRTMITRDTIVIDIYQPPQRLRYSLMAQTIDSLPFFP
ncbi:hypothetical protein OSCI_3060023 [Kamptonema sp. PCC 6506]|nr:hypothetical protein OSCI_3060023 [Kamptonema sp. PCC 6506]